ncbi:hypothetical protein JHN63_39510 [Streptomyces sp. MBT65]|uniref:hypothetical protein n=1 Tax=Streptomyces sp. MBT65 TaxID=1488395 RepID=UPI00190AF3B7|nr:hypothetical protein [Streptomyces sp. MBT65]MBK3579778.1 hypothetical protein [Streptomyces sp. MBT65]
MHPETHLALHHTRAAELQAQAVAHRLATEARAPRQELRTRLGWTLVELGLRLAATPNNPKPAVA